MARTDTHEVHFILFVADQERATAFYAAVLDCAPVLCVPGMTAFELRPGVRLGLMPAGGARRLLGAHGPRPEESPAPPRSELYLVVADADACHARALAAGATEVSPLAARDWGHRAAYARDPEGHILAFAEVLAEA
jgi:uncharacterized glyoxalase superfamily protein PhnB